MFTDLYIDCKQKVCSVVFSKIKPLIPLNIFLIYFCEVDGVKHWWGLFTVVWKDLEASFIFKLFILQVSGSHDTTLTRRAGVIQRVGSCAIKYLSKDIVQQPVLWIFKWPTFLLKSFWHIQYIASKPPLWGFLLFVHSQQGRWQTTTSYFDRHWIDGICMLEWI